MASADALDHNVLLVNSSILKTGSVTKDLANELIEKSFQGLGAPNIVYRDVSEGLPLVTEEWVDANLAEPSDRTDAQRDILSLSDRLVNELFAADTIIFSTPSLNYGVSAPLKSWIDLICRNGMTYRKTDTAHVGMLSGKKVYIVTDSGCAPIGQRRNFVLDYLTFVLNALGISDIEIIQTGTQMYDPESKFAAKRQIDEITASLELE